MTKKQGTISFVLRTTKIYKIQKSLQISCIIIYTTFFRIYSGRNFHYISNFLQKKKVHNIKYYELLLDSHTKVCVKFNMGRV